MNLRKYDEAQRTRKARRDADLAELVKLPITIFVILVIIAVL